MNHIRIPPTRSSAALGALVLAAVAACSTSTTTLQSQARADAVQACNDIRQFQQHTGDPIAADYETVAALEVAAQPLADKAASLDAQWHGLAVAVDSLAPAKAADQQPAPQPPPPRSEGGYTPPQIAVHSNLFADAWQLVTAECDQVPAAP